MKILDPGHMYDLESLDNYRSINRLQFVKREGERYPGNNSNYPGTNIQDVARVLIDRCKYLNHQIPCYETVSAIVHLREVIYQLEKRHARIKNRELPKVDEIELIPFCHFCGHIFCLEHKFEARILT